MPDITTRPIPPNWSIRRKPHGIRLISGNSHRPWIRWKPISTLPSANLPKHYRGGKACSVLRLLPTSYIMPNSGKPGQTFRSVLSCKWTLKSPKVRLPSGTCSISINMKTDFTWWNSPDRKSTVTWNMLINCNITPWLLPKIICWISKRMNREISFATPKVTMY